MSDEQPHPSSPGHPHKEHAARKPRKAPEPGKRGPVFWIVSALLGAAALWWLAGFIHHGLVYRETDDAYTQGHVHKVAARLPGDVTEVLVDDNQYVKTGQPLARLDSRETETALERAQADLAQAQADEQQAQAAIDQAKADQAQSAAATLQAETQVAQARAHADVSSLDYNRDTRLYGKDARAVSKSEVDSSQATYRSDLAAVDGAMANLAATKAGEQSSAAALATAQARLVSARAAVAMRQAAVKDAERNLSYTVITAPADGFIGNKNIEVGNRVQVGQALFAVVEPVVWVVANFKETQLGPMKKGQPAELTVDTLPGRRFTGRVDSISPAAGSQFALLPPDNATGNFTKVVQRVPVKIVFDPGSIRDVEEQLHPGLSVIASVRIK